jgi:hypothetical protein
MRISMSTATTLAAALVGVLGVAATAEAASVQYNFTSGSATLSLTGPATLGSPSLLASGSTVPLTGTQVTFDAVALQLPSFQIVDAGPSGVSGAGLLSGTTLTLTNLNIVPGPGYASFASGTNPYNYTALNIAVSGTYSLSGAINQGPTAFSSLNPSLSGQIQLGGTTTLALNGITLGTFTLPANLGPPFAGQTATLKADIIFNGLVPVPAALPLFGSALGFAGIPFMRRRRAA